MLYPYPTINFSLLLLKFAQRCQGYLVFNSFCCDLVIVLPSNNDTVNTGVSSAPYASTIVVSILLSRLNTAPPAPLVGNSVSRSASVNAFFISSHLNLVIIGGQKIIL